METGMWMFFLTVVIEVCGSLHFFDTFLEREKIEGLSTYRFLAYFIMLFTANAIGYWIGMWKLSLVLFGYVLLGRIIYKAGWVQDAFFSVLNYCMLFLTDYVACCVKNMWEMQRTEWKIQDWFWVLSSKIFWIGILFVFRRIWKGGFNYRELTDGEWLKLSLMPLFTLSAILVMYYQFGGDWAGMHSACLFISVGLVAINFLVIWLLREILDKGKKMREGIESARKKESQLAHYRDMQAVYERQGRKMHDYKNQIRTMQVLLKGGDTQAAAELAERLTESISVEMSAVNTNHPVVNAVLNQKFHAAREQGISMIFRVGDMSGMRLDGEETVILLSNLLDNAIHECVKVVRQGRKAVIHVKLVQEDGKLIFSVRNPVAEKVEVVEGTGLMNVKAVADKYGGDFAVSCDEEKFRVVVML